MSDDFDEKTTAKVLVTGVDPSTTPLPSQIGEHRGQHFEASWKFRFVETREIPAGHRIIPIEAHTENAHGFAALHLAVHDMEFALACLEQAAALGRPDASKVESKAFIFAGVVAYNRSFVENVRGVRLGHDVFAHVWNDDDRELHDYLFGLRNKHIAHSINSFERCDPVGVIVLEPEVDILLEGVSGVGVTLLNFVGINKQKLDASIHHIQRCLSVLNKRIDELRPLVHAEMMAELRNGWKMAPAARIPDAKEVGLKRTSIPKLEKFWQWLTRPPARP